METLTYKQKTLLLLLIAAITIPSTIGGAVLGLYIASDGQGICHKANK
jgi:hypothetical protein